MHLLTILFNTILECERMPECVRRRVMRQIFKNKGDVQSCNYRADEPQHEEMVKSC